MKLRAKQLFQKWMSLILACLLGLTASGALFSAAMADTTLYYTPEDQFSDRDLAQEADLSEAVSMTVTGGEDLHITSGGVYLLSGTAENVTVYVEAGKDEKVQLVLDGLSLVNSDAPCIQVTSADKVFLTVSGDSSLTVTGSFPEEEDSAPDGVVFSKSDLVLNGTAVLTVQSPENGIVSKDDLKITGGTYEITAGSKAIEANDSIRIAGGSLTLTAGTDGLHAENGDDDTLGYIYITDGNFTIHAGDDAIHANSVVQIDGGVFTIEGAEGIEATVVQINGGVLSISASDDGINAARKSGSYTPTVEINGGDLTVVMGAGDTDGIDSNGNIVINGGTVSVTGNSTFDYDGVAQLNGGTVICNGQQVASIPNQMMGGFGGGGFGGGFGGGRNGGGRNGGRPGGR